MALSRQLGIAMERPKILLVDDNSLFLEMEKEHLRSCAVTVYTARTGEEALEVMRVVLPDLVFMDLHMPQMDGDICCAAIKADPDLSKIPVIMIVTANSTEDLERCRNSGCDLVLTKPVNRGELLATGQRFLPELTRIELRIPCLTLVVIAIWGKTFHGTSVNLSTKGMFVAFEGEVDQGDEIRVTFLIPGSNGEIVEATGSVAWVNAGGLCKPSLPKGFGVKFDTIGDEAADSISRFVARSVASGLTPVVEGAYIPEPFF